MGYTHYWGQRRAFTSEEWRAIADNVKQIIDTGAVAVQFEYDIPKAPRIDGEAIRFNGQGDDGHETFYLNKQNVTNGFCKTARKPYDKLVVMILNDIKKLYPDIFSISTDGDMFELEGVKYIELLD